MHLPPPVDAVVLRMQPGDLGHQQLVPQLPGGDDAGLRGAIPAGRDETLHCRAQRPADELDPEPLSIFVDEADHLGQGRSSSFARNTLAALRIGGFNRWSQRVL